MQKHIKQQVQTVNKTFRKFNPKNSNVLIEACINTLNSKGKIIATGLGKNAPICNKFIGTLNSLGIDSHFLDTNSAIHGDLGIVKADDLVIMLSKSGESSETIYLANILKKRGTNNWLITCNKKSTTQKYVKNIILLPIDKEGDPWNMLPNNSTLVFLIFLQALTMELTEQLKIPLSTLKKNHPGGGIGKVFKHLE